MASRVAWNVGLLAMMRMWVRGSREYRYVEDGGVTAVKISQQSPESIYQSIDVGLLLAADVAWPRKRGYRWIAENSCVDGPLQRQAAVDVLDGKRTAAEELETRHKIYGVCVEH